MKIDGKIDGCPFTTDEKNRIIAQKAYYRYEKRGRTDGDSVKDWLEAESEIKKQINEFCQPTPRNFGEFIPENNQKSRANSQAADRGNRWEIGSKIR